VLVHVLSGGQYLLKEIIKYLRYLRYLRQSKITREITRKMLEIFELE
jgi:hypothetical protein